MMKASAQQAPNRCSARIPGAEKITEVIYFLEVEM